MALRSVVFCTAFAAAVLAQQPGPLTPEVHPGFPSQKCTLKGGCVTQNTTVVLDSDYRWTHTVSGYDNCKPNGLNSTLCPDAATCAKNCALEGVDYAGYGIYTNETNLRLKLFVENEDGSTKLSSPRVYLLNEKSEYELFSMLNREIAFTVDVSKLPCGTNGALYFSEMLANGGKELNATLNPAGAAYGTGYCDAQCPTPAFINGEANLEGYGSCCNEMDLWEANSQAQALTPHPCNITQVYKCSGASCGNADRYSGVCDKDGCDFNPYRLGQHSFYQPAPNMTVDTSRPFTVVTQFITTDGTDTGDLKEIRRVYVQDGKVIENAQSKVTGLEAGNSISDDFCAKEKEVFGGATNAFATQGGMKGMGEALRRGMVLIFSVWDDAGSAMKWLDGTTPEGSTSPGAARGPCTASQGNATDILANQPWVEVTFSDVKSGEIGSTYPSNSTVSASRFRRVRHA